MLLSPVKTLLSSRDLLSAWTMRIIRARYQQSILGGLWAVAQPLAMVTLFTIVFSYFIRVDTGTIPYTVFAYTAMVPWMLFSTSVTDMVDSITVNMNLVSKIYFPREVLVISTLLARLLDFLIAYSILILVMVLFKLPIFLPSWLFLPVIILVQLALGLGIGMIGAALNVFYRDVRHLFALILQLWFYATPIIYPLSLVPENIRSLYFLNPMAGIIEAYRAVIIHGTLPDTSFYISALLALIFLTGGYAFFKRLEYMFADII
jgi:lipopolysaccharide transport system permease protein